MRSQNERSQQTKEFILDTLKKVVLNFWMPKLWDILVPDESFLFSTKLPMSPTKREDEGLKCN